MWSLQEPSSGIFLCGRAAAKRRERDNLRERGRHGGKRAELVIPNPRFPDSEVFHEGRRSGLRGRPQKRGYFGMVEEKAGQDGE